MNNRNENSRSQRILDKLLIMQEFQLEIRKIRAILGIPTEGFGAELKKEEAWRNELVESKKAELDSHAKNLTKISLKLLRDEFPRFIGPMAYGSFSAHLYVYILTGDEKRFRENIGRNPFNISISSIKDFNKPTLNSLKRHCPKGLIIAIDSDITKDDLDRFIDMHFGGFMRALMRDKKPERIRSYSKIEDQKKTVRLLNRYLLKSIGKLREIAGVDRSFGCSKYDVISKILKDQHGIAETADNLRTMRSRFRKRKITL